MISSICVKGFVRQGIIIRLLDAGFAIECERAHNKADEGFFPAATLGKDGVEVRFFECESQTLAECWFEVKWVRNFYIEGNRTKDQESREIAEAILAAVEINRNMDKLFWDFVDEVEVALCSKSEMQSAVSYAGPRKQRSAQIVLDPQGKNYLLATVYPDTRAHTNTLFEIVFPYVGRTVCDDDDDAEPYETCGYTILVDSADEILPKLDAIRNERAARKRTFTADGTEMLTLCQPGTFVDVIAHHGVAGISECQFVSWRDCSSPQFSNLLDREEETHVAYAFKFCEKVENI